MSFTENISTCLLFILIDGTIARHEITAFLVTMIKQYKRPVLNALQSCSETFPQHSGRYNAHEGEARAGSLLDRTEVKIRVNKAFLKANHASIRITKVSDISFSFCSCVTFIRHPRCYCKSKFIAEIFFIRYDCMSLSFREDQYSWRCGTVVISKSSNGPKNLYEGDKSLSISC